MRHIDISGKTAQQLAADMKRGVFGTLDKLVELAREFRQRADESEREFILFLRALDLSGMWMEIDAGTFDKFIDRNHICSAERYRHATHTLDVVSNEDIGKISFASAKEIAKISEPVRRKEAIKKTVEWARKNGRPPSPQKTREIIGLRPVIRPAPPSKEEAFREEVRVLKAENKRLRTLVRKLGGDPDEA